LPGTARRDQPRLEIRYDAAAASRDMLTSILLVARDADGRVIARVRCTPKEEALATLDRQLQASAQRRYVEGLVREREEAEADRVELFAGTAAARRHRALQPDLARRRRSQKDTRGAAPAVAKRGTAAPTDAPASRRKATRPNASRKQRTTVAPAAPPPRGKRAGSRPAAPMPSASSASKAAMDTVAAQFLAADPKRRGSP
jgi:hypothetical protein